MIIRDTGYILTNNHVVAAAVGSGGTVNVTLSDGSNLVAGRQDLVPGKPLVYGQSITDGCIDWDMSVDVLDNLAHAVRDRRKAAVAA